MLNIDWNSATGEIIYRLGMPVLLFNVLRFIFWVFEIDNNYNYAWVYFVRPIWRVEVFIFYCALSILLFILLFMFVIIPLVEGYRDKKHQEQIEKAAIENRRKANEEAAKIQAEHARILAIATTESKYMQSLGIMEHPDSKKIDVLTPQQEPPPKPIDSPDQVRKKALNELIKGHWL